jgi:hypothetical protein
MVADKIYAMVEFHWKIIVPDCTIVDEITLLREIISYSYKFGKLIQEEKI